MLFDAGTTPDHSTLRTDPPSDLPAPALSSPRLRERPVQRVPARTQERSWNHQGKTTLRLHARDMAVGNQGTPCMYQHGLGVNIA